MMSRLVAAGVSVSRPSVVMMLAMVFLMTGCLELGSSWSDKNETRLVDYYKEQCDNDSTSLCFRIREDSSDSWAIVEEPFVGFDDFEWGQRYEVSVTVSFDDDGHANHYEVTGINSSDDIESSESTFSINVYTEPGILVENGSDNWQLGGEIAFDCKSACDDLSAAVANQYATRLEFNIIDTGIELGSVICASSEDDFDSDCEGESQVSWRIAWYKSECGLAEEAMCLLYKVNASDDYELLSLEDGISDFTLEWGSRYDIDVTKTVSDGGNITAVALDDTDDNPESREGLTYTFKTIVRGDKLAKPSGDLMSLYGDDSDMSLRCDNGDSSASCSNFDDYIEDDKWLLLHGYVDGDEIIVTEVLCDDNSLTDFRDCVDNDDDVTWGI